MCPKRVINDRYHELEEVSAETTQALFVAVEEDDLVEANISPPQQIDLDCPLRASGTTTRYACSFGKTAFPAASCCNW